MASFNYMVILGEFQRGEAPPTTSYYEFYQSMIKVPYLGSSIPILLPSMIILFTLIFAGLSALKLKNRVIHAFRVVASESSKEDDESKTLVEAILRGERAILQEIKLARTKAERNKLLRYNQPASLPPPTVVPRQPKKQLADEPKQESQPLKTIFAKVTLIEEEQKELSRSLLEKHQMNSSI